MEEIAMAKMTKERAKIIHLKALHRVLEQKLEYLVENGTVDEFLEVSRDLDTLDHRIQVQENFLEEGFNTKVKETQTVPSNFF